ncbi:hypothetical protein J0H58_28830 [bacterium]|nr:hypothetical protein [bacterium]
MLLFTNGDGALGYVASKNWGEFTLCTLLTPADAAAFIRNPPASFEPGDQCTGVSIDHDRELPAVPLMFSRAEFLRLLGSPE